VLDIKLKKSSRAFLAAISMFLAIFMLALLLLTALFAANDTLSGDRQIVSSLEGNLYESKIFKERVAYFLNGMADIINPKEQTDSTYIYQKILEEEIENNNLLVYGGNGTTGAEYLPNATDFGIKANKNPVRTKNFDNYFFFDGYALYLCQGDTKVNLAEAKDGQEFFQNQEVKLIENPQDYFSCYLYLAVNNEIVPGIEGSSYLYRSVMAMNSVKILLLIILAGGLTGAFLGVFAARHKKLVRAGNHILAYYSNKLFVEVKLLFAGAIVYIFQILYQNLEYEIHYFVIGAFLSAILYLFCIYAVIYILCVDFFFNRSRFFKNNIFLYLLDHYKEYEKKKSMEKLLLVRLRWYSVVLGVFFCAANGFFILYLARQGDIIYMVFMLLCCLMALLCYFRYKTFYKRFLDDVTALSGQVEKLRAGEYDSKAELSRASLLQPVADSLASIQDGIRDTVDEYVKNEHMKIDLITNVSHDLKTPLTSIVSYVNLLSKEKELPPRAKEYVEVLEDKSQRLKHLIEDLFDLSKASSRNIEVHREPLDFGKLTRQVCADLEDTIAATGLKFVYKFAEGPILIRSDGNRLHRVLENLVVNASKYSMPGTRVHLSLSTHLNTVMFEISNVSATEIDYTEDEIIGRFVRGDKNRSTDGSGLGLAIAKSYTELCGGTMRIFLDGDLFKAVLYFPLETPEEKSEVKRTDP
jgi:signal transduction histidine kinase